MTVRLESTSTGWETFLRRSDPCGLRYQWDVADADGAWKPARGKGYKCAGIADSSGLSTTPSGRPDRRHVASFSAALKSSFPMAFVTLQHGNIAPVDLAQAAIGPGMAVFTRYSKVLDADGNVAFGT